MLIALWEKIKAMAHNFSDNMAEAIRAGDTKHIAGGIFFLGLTALGCLGIAVGIRNFAVMNANFLFTWVGLPIFAGWGLVCVLSSPQLGNIGGKTVIDPAVLRAKAEEMYALMRDVAYLILRDVSDYTTVICPSRLGTVETAHRFRFQDGVIIFEFMAAISGPVDAKALRDQLQRHITQRLRSRELPGLTSEVFISKSGRPYSIIQCLSVVDFSDFVQISLVFCDESAVEILDAKSRAESEVRKAQPRDVDF